MNMHHRPVALAAVLAIVLSGSASIAAARQAESAPVASPPASAADIQPGTETTATYRLQDGTLTVRAGMPAQVKDYGPPPAFSALDSNHDGRISEDEAQAYPPLDSDFLYASGGAKTISASQYQKWVAGQQ